MLRRLTESVPILKKATHKFWQWTHAKEQAFQGSADYWNKRYDHFGNSGDGSYGKLAEFKAEILNRFVDEKKITSVIEFGSGDGNQLSLASYPQYLGIDISPAAVELCRKKFSHDVSKSFIVLENYGGQKAELALSLDVLFHLVEDQVYEDYMHRLFNAAERYVIVYSSNKNDSKTSPHVRHRLFSEWVQKHQPSWKCIDTVKNKYPFAGDTAEGSFADFYFYQKSAQNPVL